MLTAEENEAFTRVGPGTPMGRLLRWYWHPIAAATQLDENPVMPVKLLGESLVLYRDRSGTLGLVQSACAHRRVNLVFGVVEDAGIRCPYHGWRYDESGQCLEMPAEPLDTTFPQRVKLTAYPVQELAGLIFAYLGPQPAPLLPRWDLFTYDGVLRDIGFQVLPCNWLQMQENDTDPAHLQWLHGRFANYVLERLGQNVQRPSGDAFSGPIGEKRGWQPYDQGIMNVDRRGDNPNEWRAVRPSIFPNMNSFATELMYRVPVDDTHTLHVFYAAYAQDPARARVQDKVPYFTIPASVTDEMLPIWPELDNNGGQDAMAWIAQGDIVDRSQEHLAESDRGILMYRDLMRRQLRIVEDGGEPMNVFRDPAQNQRIEIPPRGPLVWTGADHAVRGRATGQYKHSPVMKEMVETYQGKEALSGPVH